MCLEQSQKYFLKRKLAVVSLLIRNVTPHHLRLRLAHSEGAVAVLPVKAPELREGIMANNHSSRLSRGLNTRIFLRGVPQEL